MRHNAPIAIVGLACRFPGRVRTPAELWSMLARGEHAVRPVADSRRFDANVDWSAGSLDDIADFDARFFGLSAEAAELDPRHRLLLEVTWEALEDAGCRVDAVPERRVGIFLGIYGERYPGGSHLGTAPGMSAARLGHFLDARGPAIVIDTTCSSSLVAFHHAVESLRRCECDVALVGGANLLSSNVADTPDGLLAPDGLSKPFDDAANGFGVGEGCAVVVLKRAADAARDADRVYATVLGSAVNHDGRSSSVVAPNPAAQARVIAAAVAAAGVDHDSVQYIEAHGTGTILGDPIEVQGITTAFSGRTRPLLIGSIKGNVGHLEAAAGIAGVVKVALAISNRQLPPSLHFKKPNRYIPWHEIPIRVQTTLGAWPEPAAPLVAGISSFGLSGTNAHVVLADAANEHRSTVFGSSGRPDRPFVLTLSARTPVALSELAGRYLAFLHSRDCPDESRVAYTASCRRTHFRHRMAVVGRDRREWAERLQLQLSHEQTASTTASARQGVVFVFAGQGTQWAGMAKELFANDVAFAETVREVAGVVEREVALNVLDVFRSSDSSIDLSRTEVAQPALFALQAGLVAVLRGRGLTPAAVVGHSLGEIGAAYAAGVLSLEDGATLAGTRGMLMACLVGKGRMAAVALESEAVRAALTDLSVNVDVAADNAPSASVISGPDSDIERAVEFLARNGIAVKTLAGQCAFHSAQLRPLMGRLQEKLVGRIEIQEARIPIISTLRPHAEHVRMDLAYWAAQMAEPVLFRPAINRLLEDGHSAFLELAPAPVLMSSVLDTAAAQNVKNVVAVSTLQRSGSDLRSIEEAFAALHVSGVAIDWSRCFPSGVTPVSLPTYAWQHQRYWHTPRRQDLSENRRLISSSFERRTRTFVFESSVLQALRTGKVRFGISAVLALMRRVVADAYRGTFVQLDVETVRYPPSSEASELICVLNELSGACEFKLIASERGGREAPLASGRVVLLPEFEALSAPNRGGILERCREYAGTVAIDSRWPETDSVSDATVTGALHIGDHELLLDVPAAVPSTVARELGVADLALWIVCGGLGCEASDNGLDRGAIGPSAKILLGDGHEAAYVHCSVAYRGAAAFAELTFVDNGDRIVGRVSDLMVDCAVPWAEIHREACLFDVRWEEADTTTPHIEGGKWLVVCGKSADVASLQREITGLHAVVTTFDENGAECVGDALREIGSDARKIVVLQPPNEAKDHALGMAIMERSLERVAFCTALAEKLLALKRRGDSRLVVVTQGAQAVGRGDVDVVQAPLWGFCASLAREYRNLRVKLVDLDGTAESNLALSRELLSDDRENRVALRAGRRYVQRLVHGSQDAEAEACKRGLTALVRGDRTYLITGGLGGLGRLTAFWLAESGARHLVLIGRSPPSAEALDDLDSLRAGGVDVRVEQCDITRADHVEQMLARIAASMPKVAGVVHSAGVLRDATLGRLTPEHYSEVFAPKVLGGWNLHRAARDLDFFVCYSSVSSVLGNAGQCNYAAANAFLDALAHHRSALGSLSRVINWGAWHGIGMTRLLRTHRHRSLHDRLGKRAFNCLLQGNAVQIVADPALLGGVDDDRRGDERLLETTRSDRLHRSPTPVPVRDPRAYSASALVRRELAAYADVDPRMLNERLSLQALGVDSLGLIRLRHKIAALLGHSGDHEVKPDTTVGALLRQIDAHSVPCATDRVGAGGFVEATSLVWLKRSGNEPTLVLVHPVGGGIGCYTALAQQLTLRTVAIQHPAINDSGTPALDVPAMAERYVQWVLDAGIEAPLALGGWSLGGVVAYEMGAILATRKVEVPFVTMLDSGQRSDSGAIAERERRLAARRFLESLAQANKAMVDDASVETLVGLQSEEELHKFVDHCAARGILVDLPAELVVGLLRAFLGNLQALSAYSPSRYDGRVVVVGASETPHERLRSWTRCAPAAEVVSVDGDHYSIMEPPTVDVIARIISGLASEPPTPENAGRRMPPVSLSMH